MWKLQVTGSGIDFGYSGSKISDPAIMENMGFNIRDRKLHIIPIWVNATDICTIHEEIVLRWLIYILKSELMSVNRAPKARAKIHVYINMTNVWKMCSQEYEFGQKFTIANLAKVFQFSFARWISPSPLAKCEGLCASLSICVCAIDHCNFDLNN